jgi:hypothetical protein
VLSIGAIAGGARGHEPGQGRYGLDDAPGAGQSLVLQAAADSLFGIDVLWYFPFD